VRLSGRQLSWLRIRAVSRRHYYVLLRAPHRLFDVTIWPLVDVLLFGSIAAFVSPGHATAGHLAAGYLLSGILLWHVVYQSQIALATGFLEEAWTRNLLNLMVTPIREVEYVAGVALFGMFKLALGVGVVALGALVFYSFDVSTLGFGLIPIAAVLLLVGWTISLFVIGVVLRFGSGAEALARLVSQITSPVRFDACLATMRELGVTAAIELPPAGPWVIDPMHTSVVATADVLPVGSPADLDRARELLGAVRG